MECFNLIYTHLNVQYLDIHTLKCAYISLTFQSQCNMTFIHWLFLLILGVKVLHIKTQDSELQGQEETAIITRNQKYMTTE